MRTRTVLPAAVLAAVAAVPLAGVASAQQLDGDCRDFASQAAAQSALRLHSGNPQRLDPDHNGVACEDYFKLPGARAVPAAAPVPGAPASPVARAVPAAAASVPGAPASPVAPAPTTAAAATDTARDTASDTARDTAAEPAVDHDATPRLVLPPPDAPAEAVVHTVPERRILVAPHGAADTGDGSTAPAGPADGAALLLLGVGGAAVALGARQRSARRSR
jgi:hypothetical protein